MLNLVCFTAVIAELVRGEKPRTQSLSLLDATGTEAFALEENYIKHRKRY